MTRFDLYKNDKEETIEAKSYHTIFELTRRILDMYDQSFEKTRIKFNGKNIEKKEDGSKDR